MISSFKTIHYEGAWIPFDGDRRRFRLSVQDFLRTALNDQGELVVDDQGPHWMNGTTLAGLSYAQTEGWGVVVFSRTHLLGVDLEKQNRVFQTSIVDLAKRFFHESEFPRVRDAGAFESKAVFMDLWMKKEAYSKLMRVGLASLLGKPLDQSQAEFECIPLVRVGFEARVAILAR